MPRSRLLTLGLPLTGLAASIFAASAIASSQPQRLEAPPLYTPPEAPALLRAEAAPPAPAPLPAVEGRAAPVINLAAGVIGAIGVIEPESETIAVAPVVAGRVTQLLVQAGDKVAAGQPLLRLDDRAAQAEIAAREADRRAAQQRQMQIEAERAQVQAQVAGAAAQVAAAQAELQDAREQAAVDARLAPAGAVATREASRNRFTRQAAEARVRQAEADRAAAAANLTILEARKATAAAEVQQAEALLAQARTALELLTVTAPVAGTILRVDARPGEYAQTQGGTATTLMQMGDIEPLHVRVEVDEADIPRFRREAMASVSLRGDARTTAPLRLVRIEPQVVPKTNLTNAASERVDTRVLQVIYALDPAALRVQVGQQVDVFIEAALPPGQVAAAR